MVQELQQTGLESQLFNPSRNDPEQREKINLNIYFHTSLQWLQRFYKSRKALHKTFCDTTKKCQEKRFGNFLFYTGLKELNFF